MEYELSTLESIKRNPFRIFFPLGIVAGCFGVGQWAMWTMGYPVPDIKSHHLILQSQGFLAFFVIGFLMTAFPRFSGTGPATLIEISIASSGAFLFLIGAFQKQWAWAHSGTLIMLITIPLFALYRLPQRTKDLPPSFLLLGIGLAHASLGALFSLLTNMGETNFYIFSVGRQMIQVGFLLCMVLGITAKLAPFLMGYTDDPGCEEGAARICFSKKHEILIHCACGLLILTSFFIEPFLSRFALGVRAMVSTAHLFLFAKINRSLRKRTTTIIFFWLSCWMILLGFWLAFFLPQYRVAALHVVFIGGFSLMIFSFGLIVVLSHSGKAALLNGKLWTLKGVGLMVLLALGFRVAADFVPNHHMFFLHNASGFWVVAGVAWFIYVIPKMRENTHVH